MQQRLIVPPTGDGVPCLCGSGPKLPNGTVMLHTHGEFRQLLPRFRHKHREPSGLVGGKRISVGRLDLI
jgi:hypothetical protein